MSTITLPDAVDEFVAATNAHDAEALVAVFAADAVVIDDGTTYDTQDRIREWLTVHQIEPRVVITPMSFESGRLLASVDGDFPGGPLRFAFDVTETAGRIARLEIRAA
ncbi:nuclear transport factor 2 family protein [Rathayibacter sp. SD072]|uniref:nuclear transport factor 2 family protein n=1 Tax=Rathayibacter sp. SD072 TaxID=2781731 RepID=UPI001A96F8ED|nr:nuclear transport factor 2 family protein [Rathayibacter sp. SD072]MBO0983619.1 nuclear transport factor 2 family protein [Rathayibacter sp. SD072]